MQVKHNLNTIAGRELTPTHFSRVQWPRVHYIMFYDDKVKEVIVFLIKEKECTICFRSGTAWGWNGKEWEYPVPHTDGHDWSSHDLECPPPPKTNNKTMKVDCFYFCQYTRKLIFLSNIDERGKH